MDLVNLWFVLLAVLWAGFFFLEGFDFGVGVLAIAITRNESERSQALASIGPVWDADEVWLITAAAAIFAAFPKWFGTLFPAAYLPLLLVIVGLVVRAVSIEYRQKRSAKRWRRRWDVGIATASALLPFLFGVFWAGVLRGVPISADGVGPLLGLELISVYSILGGLVLLSFSLAHGATFLALKTTGGVEHAARVWATRLIVIAGALMTAFAVWTYASFSRGDVLALVFGLLSVIALAIALLATHRKRFLIAFWMNALAILGYTGSIFIALFPNAVPSSVDPQFDLTLANAATGSYPLAFISIIALVAVPLVLLYQAWTFWVFRQRLAPGGYENEG